MRKNWYENCYTEQLNVEDALAVAKYPASGSFKDVSRFTHFGFLICVGALDTEVVAQVYQDTSATQTGSVKVITGATVTIAALDDDQTHFIEVAVENLDIGNDFRYVTLDLTGPAGANDYAAIVFVGWNVREAPVTQPATFPAANSVRIAG